MSRFTSVDDRFSEDDAGKLRVFISYSREDLGFADQLDATLRKRQNVAWNLAMMKSLAFLLPRLRRRSGL